MFDTHKLKYHSNDDLNTLPPFEYQTFKYWSCSCPLFVGFCYLDDCYSDAHCSCSKIEKKDEIKVRSRENEEKKRKEKKRKKKRKRYHR